ncbi:MAG: ferrochelatase, partial [Acidimicrobiia bacterium]|nr:ferrochelatase [Acidimicrobiia bacterium]
HPITTTEPFYDDTSFAKATTEIAAPLLEEFDADHVLFSYHGLPESQIRKGESKQGWCLKADDSCCDTIRNENRYCYRAQCFATTRRLVEELGLPSGTYSTTFQSRLAGQRWIGPYTDHALAALREQGVERLAVLTPSFVSDCLETLEEIGVRLREQWESMGGEDLLLVPCVNSNPTWATGLADLVRQSV